MKRTGSIFVVALAAAVLPACGGSDKPVKAPGSPGKLAGPLAAAFREEATGDAAKAIDLYIKALDGAGASRNNNGALGGVVTVTAALVAASNAPVIALCA